MPSRFTAFNRLLLTFGCCLLLAATSAAETLTVGAVGNAQKESAALAPLMKYLESRTGASTAIAVYPDIDRLAQAIAARKVDFFMDSPFPAAKVCSKSSARFFLRQWKGGIPEYNGIIIVRGGTATTPNDLKGQMLSFEDRDSTASFLLPMLMLKQARIPVVEKSSPKDPVGPNEIGYVFSSDDASSIAWLDKRQVFAAGMKKERIANRPDLKILVESPTVPRSVVCVGSHLPPATAQRLETVLTGMNSDSAAQEALAALGKTNRFDALPQGAEVTQRAMTSMIKLLDY